VGVELDPRHAPEVVAAMPPELSCGVAVAMARQGEHVAMARFVAHLERATIAACVTQLDDEDLVCVARALEESDPIETLVEIVGVSRIARLADRLPAGEREAFSAAIAQVARVTV
jgi:hypothetical protein